MQRDYLDTIKRFEGFSPRATWDYKQHSNGFGTKAAYPGEVITPAEAERRFQAVIEQSARAVDTFAPGLDEGTRAALTSLTYNAGTQWMHGGLGAAIRSGDFEKARELFLQYNKAGGEVLPGLAARRLQEAAWFDGARVGETVPAIVAGVSGAAQVEAPLASANPALVGRDAAPPADSPGRSLRAVQDRPQEAAALARPLPPAWPMDQVDHLADLRSQQLALRLAALVGDRDRAAERTSLGGRNDRTSGVPEDAS